METGSILFAPNPIIEPREWARIEADGTIKITFPDGSQRVATPDEAVAIFVRVAAEEGWAGYRIVHEGEAM